MKVLLDDVPCEVNATTVGEALDAASALVEPRGRLIVDVSVDGKRWTEADLSCSDRTDSGAEIVRFTSAVPRELVRQTFADAADSLADVADLQRETAELLQADRRAVSLDKLNEAISIWLHVQQAIVKGSRLAGINLDTVSLPRPLEASIAVLNQRLEAVYTALARDDMIALADTLLYEFPEVVEEWGQILDELQRLLETPSQ